MHLSVSSNLLSGAYTFLELCITVIVARFLTLLLEACNVKTVYHDRATLHLSRSKWFPFTNYGLTSNKLHIAAAFVFATVVILSTIGGFAITGVSKAQYEPVTVKNLVRKAKPSEFVNYLDHISFEDKLYSGTVYLLFQHIGCKKSSNLLSPLVYEYANDLNDLHTPVFRPEAVNLNQTCITTTSGFQQSVAVNLTGARIYTPPEVTADCALTISEDSLEIGKLTRMRAKQPNGCRFRLTQAAFCIRQRRVFCAVGATNERGGHAVWTVASQPQFGQPADTLLAVPQAADDRLLSAMTILLALETEVLITSLWAMPQLAVQRDGRVWRYVGERSETEVNGRLLAGTLGTALAVLMIVGLGAAIAWIGVIGPKERRGYNRFNSPLDVVSLVANGANFLREEDRRAARHRKYMVWIDGSEPRVGVRGQAHYIDDDDLHYSRVQHSAVDDMG